MSVSDRSRSGCSEIRNITLKGVVDIKMTASHKDAHAKRLSIGPRTCTWSDDEARVVFRHTFHHELSEYFPYRDVAKHGERTLTFDYRAMRNCEAECFVAGHEPHSRTIPCYVFSNREDYKKVQSLIRGTAFVRDFETTSIDCGASGAQSNPDQCVKLWADSKLTIPVSLHYNDGWKLKHAEVSARWLTWEKSGSRKVKAKFDKIRRRSSAEVHPQGARRFSFAPKNVLNRHREQSVSEKSPGEEEARTGAARQWQHFSFEFSDTEGRDAFFDTVTGPPIISGTRQEEEPQEIVTASPPPLDLPSPAIPVSSLPSTSTTPSIGPTTIPSRQDSVISTEITEAQLHLLGSSAHDYLRVNGPDTVHRVIANVPHAASPTATLYHRLTSPDAFRLLRIESGDDNDPVRCHLDHFLLSNAPSFESMSYCWGTQPAQSVITMGDKREPFLISPHLWNALRRIRKSKKDRLLWIDALCIDQDNLRERNHQIVLMRRIYSAATRTLIWLGDHDISRRTCERSFPDENGTELTLCMQPELGQMEHPLAVQDLHADLLSLQRHNNSSGKADVWWRRLWVVQEFRFSRLPCSVYIGPHAVKWDHFYAICLDPESPLALSNPLAPFSGLRDHTPTSLTQLLTMTSAFHCSDPRDRVFALLGLAEEAAKQLNADYGRSIIRVLEDACFYLIQERQTLDVLLDNRLSRTSWGRDQLRDVLPTWLPDLTCLSGESLMQDTNKNNAGLPNDETPLLPVVDLGEGKTILVNGEPMFELPRALICRAVEFDTIEARTTAADIPRYEHSPDGCLIYTSLKERGHVTDKILNHLGYDFEEHVRRNEPGRDNNPGIGRLMLDYLLEDRRSYVKEMDKMSKPPERDVVTSYEHQQKADLEYLDYEARSHNVAQDREYVKDRWELKIRRAEADQHFTPERMKPALASGNRKIEEDFQVARDIGNLFAYARKTHKRYYFDFRNPEAPMHRNVLGCSNIDKVKKLPTQFYTKEEDLEIHEYNPKSRQRDFFKTSRGFLGLGPADMEVGDRIIIPFGASRPWILREHASGGEVFYTLVGSAVVPSIMSGSWMRLKQDSSAQDYRIK